MCMAWTLSGVFHVAALTCNAPAMAFAPAPFLCGCRVGEADVPGPGGLDDSDDDPWHDAMLEEGAAVPLSPFQEGSSCA